MTAFETAEVQQQQQQQQRRDGAAAFFPSPTAYSNGTTTHANTAGLSGDHGRNRPPSPPLKPPNAANFREMGASGRATKRAPQQTTQLSPGSPYHGVAAQEQPSMVAGSLNTFLNGAYAGVPVAGAHLRAGEGGLSGRASSSAGGGGGGGGGATGSVFGGAMDGPLRQLIETKERELHEIHDFRIRSLEGLLEEREVALADSFARYDKLKEDFKFNLGLIEDRDVELGRYEAAVQGLKECLRDKEVEASEAKMRLDEALSVHRQAAARENEQQGYWQAKCKALRDEMDGLRWAREEESRASRERAEAQRAALTRQLREREDELEAQRADSAEAFDRIMQQRQEEAQARESELALQLREAESRCADQARRRERVEREATELRENYNKVRQALEAGEKEARGLRWELEDRQQIAVAESDEAAKRVGELEKSYEAAVHAGEERLREVLGSLHAVEKAFVQHKDRQSAEEQAFQQREGQLRSELEACGSRAVGLEQALADAGQREEELRKLVRVAREEHGRETAALRKQAAEKEALLRTDADHADGAASALRDANLSLEGKVAGMAGREAALQSDLREEREDNARLKRSLDSAGEEINHLREQVSEARQAAETAAFELEQCKRELEKIKETARSDRRELQGRVDTLQDALATAARSASHLPHVSAGKGSPLFSDDQGLPSPLPPNPPPPPRPPDLSGNSPAAGAAGFAGRHTDAMTGSKGGGGAGVADGGEEGGRGAGFGVPIFPGLSRSGGGAEEFMELQAANLRLRGVVADMRREMEAFRDPGMEGGGRGGGARERDGDGNNEALIEELSELRGRLEYAEGPAVVELEEELSRLQNRCERLVEEVERLSAERDKLMDIGNSLRAELNRALSNSFEGGGPNGTAAAAEREAQIEERTVERVREAVSRAQRETRRKYRARVSEVEAAFAQLAGDNRRLKAKVARLTTTTDAAAAAAADDDDDDGSSGSSRSGLSPRGEAVGEQQQRQDGRKARHRRGQHGAPQPAAREAKRAPASSLGLAAAGGRGVGLAVSGSAAGRVSGRRGRDGAAPGDEVAAASAAATDTGRSKRLGGDRYNGDDGLGVGGRSGERDFAAVATFPGRTAVEESSSWQGELGRERGQSEQRQGQQHALTSQSLRARRNSFNSGLNNNNNNKNGEKRQTEGQRAAAMRLRAWQERRRLEDAGGVRAEEARQRREQPHPHLQQRRSVRNYNIRED